MRQSSERTILICEKCGEKMVIVGPEDVWRSGRNVFECACGERHTLTGRRRGSGTIGDHHPGSELPALNLSLLGGESV